MAVNLKKDPTVIALIDAAVSKAVVAAVKGDRTRMLNLVKFFAAGNKESDLDKAAKSAVANSLKDVANTIKNGTAAAGE